MTWTTLVLLCAKHSVYGSEGSNCLKCAEEQGWRITSTGSVSTLPATLPLVSYSVPADANTD